LNFLEQHIYALYHQNLYKTPHKTWQNACTVTTHLLLALSYN